MSKFTSFISLIIISHTISTHCVAQSPYYSESLIKYDLLTHKTDKPIPFDRSFTLVIEKLSSKNVVAVHAYEAEFKNGNRLLVKNIFRDCDGSNDTAAVKDIILKTNPYSDTLQIFFPPLMPNVDFDINVIYGISKDCREALMKLNAQLSTAAASANTTFNQFLNCTIDKIANRTYTNINFAQYQAFYTANLAANYNKISNVANFTSSGSLTEIQIQAIDVATSKDVSDFRDGYFLLESSKRALFGDIILGNRDISKVFLKDDEALTSLPFGNLRLQNLESNIKYFDTVFKRLDRVISKGTVSVTISGTDIDLNATRTALSTIRTNIQNNYSYLETELKAINDSINNDDRLKQGIYLAGNTLSSDLKSAGGNVLFLDAGFTNIIAPGVTNKAVYIPKLYWGVSIYFRPIDKNTRRNRFPSKFNPALSNGCTIDPATGLPTYGPDYGIVAKYSIWQHLSLNIGITLGSMYNKDFDNFYNSNSLLIGPAYRFARAFKVSSGLALLKRSSQNPLISEKKIIPAGYLSLSVDIDFIQGLKDITSILFK